MSDGPQRKTVEEIESLKYAQGISQWPASTSRDRRPDVGNVEMTEATADGIPWGTPEVLNEYDGQM